MSLVLAVIFTVIAVAAFAALLVLTLTIPSSPLCIRRRPEAQAEPAVAPVPEPRVPRDTSRAYPRLKGGRSKLNRTCPVCGTGQETGSLDGKVLGWPAHRTCAEWLGDWEPPRPVPPQFKPDPELIGRMEQAQKPVPPEKQACDGCGVPLGTGVRYHDTAGRHYCPACDRKGFGRQPVAPSPAEARERLNREIIASWGVPPAILEEHTRKAGDPLPVERCPGCGARFVGTPGYLRMAYKLHRQLGCRQSSSSPPG